jgi:hypothetical protein
MKSWKYYKVKIEDGAWCYYRHRGNSRFKMWCRINGDWEKCDFNLLQGMDAVNPVKEIKKEEAILGLI